MKRSSTTDISKTASDSPRDYRLHPQSMDRLTGVFGEHVGKLFELMIAGQMPRLQLDYVMERSRWEKRRKEGAHGRCRAESP